jgi:hypothetical protein
MILHVLEARLIRNHDNLELSKAWDETGGRPRDSPVAATEASPRLPALLQEKTEDF